MRITTRRLMVVVVIVAGLLAATRPIPMIEATGTGPNGYVYLMSDGTMVRQGEKPVPLEVRHYVRWSDGSTSFRLSLR